MTARSSTLYAPPATGLGHRAGAASGTALRLAAVCLLCGFAPGCGGSQARGRSVTGLVSHETKPVPGQRGPRRSDPVDHASCVAACGEDVISCAWSDPPPAPTTRDVECDGILVDGGSTTKYLSQPEVSTARAAGITPSGAVPQAACPALCASKYIRFVQRCEALPEEPQPLPDQRWVVCETPSVISGTPGT